MSKGDEGCAEAGCGCAVILVVVSLVITGIQAYVAHVSAGGAIAGGVVGALLGAACGGIVVPIGRKYREKARVGPLSLLWYGLPVARLRGKFLGE